MKKISIVISSLRPDRLEETIDSTAMHADLIEVVVISPSPPKPRDFVRHIPVPPPGDPKELTFTQKFNLGAENARYEYIVFNNDDFHFRPGWASALIRHMEQKSVKPYLAGFHLATRGVVHTRYTAFGMLYANIGCIRKADLKLVGGKLFDDRYYMYTSDIDLSMRIWKNGGEVGLCHEVIVDSDRDVDQVMLSQKSVFAKKRETIPSKRTYRDEWFEHDNDIFFRTWFPKYFWMFLKNYSRLRDSFTNEDGVLPVKRYNSGLLRVMFWPILNMFVKPKLFFERKYKLRFIQKHWVRVVNRRWKTIDYQLPYDFSKVVRS